MKCEFIKVSVISHGGAYGLKAELGGGEVRIYDEITFDEAAIELLADRINSLEVSAAHLDEILEDFIG